MTPPSVPFLNIRLFCWESSLVKQNASVHQSNMTQLQAVMFLIHIDPVVAEVVGFL